MEARPGPAADPGRPGIRPALILAPVLAWLAVAGAAFLYFDPRGRWKSSEGTEAYRDCFGKPPAEGLRPLRSLSLRHYRLTGEMLSMECYVLAEGEPETPEGGSWEDAPSLRGDSALAELLRARGMSRPPEWFRLPEGAEPDSIRVKVHGPWFSLRAGAGREALIGGGWRTRSGREAEGEPR